MLALMRGELAEAERLVLQTMALQRRHGIAVHEDQLSVLIFTLRREQGRLAELGPVVAAFLRSEPAASAWRPGLALVYLEIGQRTPRAPYSSSWRQKVSPPSPATGDGCSAWSISARSAPRSVMPSGQPSCID